MNTALPGATARARIGTTRPAPISARGRLALAGVLLAALAGCAGHDPIASLAPPQTNVAAVPDDKFLSVGTTTAPDRREPLSTEQQQKLQKDLERVAKKQATTSTQATSGN